MTPAFFSLDQILSRMNQPDYSIKNANMLDKIAHELHMQEGWTLSGKQYQVSILEQQHNKYLIIPHPLGLQGLDGERVTAETCWCLERVHANETLEELKWIAKQIRTPELVYFDADNNTKNIAPYSYSVPIYRHNFKDHKRGEKLAPIASIQDEDTWKVRRDATIMPQTMMQSHAAKLAMYLFCKINYS